MLKQIGYRFPFEKLMELRRQCFRFLEIIIDRLNCRTTFSDTDGSSEQIIAMYWSNKVIRVKNWWECQRTMLLIPGKDDLPENWKFMQDNQTSCGRIHWHGHYKTAKAVNSDCSFKETIKFSDRLKNIFNFVPKFIPPPPRQMESTTAACFTLITSRDALKYVPQIFFNWKNNK